MSLGKGLWARAVKHAFDLSKRGYHLFVARGVNWDREGYLASVQRKLTAIESFKYDITVFYKVPASWTNPLLTLVGCNRYCGEGASLYSDIGPRLMTWYVLTQGRVWLCPS